MRLLFFLLTALSAITNACMDEDEIRLPNRVITVQLNKALQRVKQVLDSTRNPEYFDNVPHSYDDKYTVAQTTTQTAIAAQLNAFSDLLGLSQDKLSQMVKWASENKTVTMRFEAKGSVVFSHKAEREIESPTRVESTGFFSTTTHKVVTKVTDYHWKVGVQWELMLYAGAYSTQQHLKLAGSKNEIKTITPTDHAPSAFPEASRDVDLTWLAQHLGTAPPHSAKFEIDRTSKTCHTPRRNDQVRGALEALSSLEQWSWTVTDYFSSIWRQQVPDERDFPFHECNECFLPILPLFEVAADSNKSVPLPQSDVNKLLEEQHQSLLTRISQLRKESKFNGQHLVGMQEVEVALGALHIRKLSRRFSQVLDSIELLLLRQLKAAIGSEITPAEFGQYMRYHQRNLLLPNYQATDFSVAVRRPKHDPEGLLSIEYTKPQQSVPTIQTLVRRFDVAGDTPMQFEISTGVTVSFSGPKYLHAALMHKFSDDELPQLNIMARTRQFSSFMLLLGQIAPGNKFLPSHAIMLQNKDELVVPLSVAALPSAKQFADAIESLSPEQREFAVAFRGMQLGTTLFGMCVVQIKPQLELLLHLPPQSLTKEIQLSQDLLELFLEYQIPSDLLSYDGEENMSLEQKLNQVKGHVSKMKAMIQQVKVKELGDEVGKAAKKLASGTILNDGLVVGSKADLLDNWMDLPTTRHLADSSISSMTLPRAFSVKNLGDGLHAKEYKRVLAKEQAVHQEQAIHQEQEEVVTTKEANQPADSKAGKGQQTASEGGEEQDKPKRESTEAADTGDFQGFDVTTLPRKLDQELLVSDEEAAVRPAVVKLGPGLWVKRSVGLLGDGAKPASATLNDEVRNREKHRAFDLLDALSKGGALPLQEASLHVLTASVHTFDKTILDTIIQENVNPIARVEKSLLLLASVVHDKAPQQLVAPREIARLQKANPQMFK